MRAKNINNVEELEKIMQGKSIDNALFKRVQVVYWRSQKKSLKEVSLLSGFCIASIVRHCALYRTGGIEALKSNIVGGNFRKLSFAKEAAALEACKELSSKGGFIRVAELQAEFEKAAGVHYHPHVFYRLLKRHGWRKVKPRGRHPKKASDEAIEASKKLT